MASVIDYNCSDFLIFICDANNSNLWIDQAVGDSLRVFEVSDCDVTSVDYAVVAQLYLALGSGKIAFKKRLLCSFDRFQQ